MKKTVIIKMGQGDGKEFDDVVKKMMGKSSPMDEAEKLIKTLGNEDEEEYEEKDEEYSKYKSDYSDEDMEIKQEAMEQESLRDALEVLLEKGSDELLKGCIKEVIKAYI